MLNILSLVFDFLTKIHLPLIGTDFCISIAQILVVNCITLIVFHIIISFFNR